MVSHGDFICHPRPCERYNHGTVVEFYCDPGYSLTSDYKYITCQYGEWFPSYQVYCIKSGEHTLPRQGHPGRASHRLPSWAPHTRMARYIWSPAPHRLAHPDPRAWGSTQMAPRTLQEPQLAQHSDAQGLWLRQWAAVQSTVVGMD